LLERFPQRHRLSRRLSGIGVPPWLEPAVELPVVQEERALAIRGDDDGTSRQVSFGDAPVEGILVPADEVADLPEVARLFVVRGRVAEEPFEEFLLLAGRHPPDSSPSVASSGRAMQTARGRPRAGRRYEMELVPINLEETLFVSGEIDDWTVVRGRGIDTIVDMDGDVDPGVPEGPGEVLYVYYPIRDEALPDLRKLEALGRMVADLVCGEHRVLVHCRMGYNRS